MSNPRPEDEINAVAESLLLALFLVIAIIGAAGAAIAIAWRAAG